MRRSTASGPTSCTSCSSSPTAAPTWSTSTCGRSRRRGASCCRRASARHDSMRGGAVTVVCCACGAIQWRRDRDDDTGYSSSPFCGAQKDAIGDCVLRDVCIDRRRWVWRWRSRRAGSSTGTCTGATSLSAATRSRRGRPAACGERRHAPPDVGPQGSAASGYLHRWVCSFDDCTALFLIGSSPGFTVHHEGLLWITILLLRFLVPPLKLSLPLSCAMAAALTSAWRWPG